MRTFLAATSAISTLVIGITSYAQADGPREIDLEGQTERHKASQEAPIDLRLVGFTAKRSAGTVGLFQLHAICKEEFSLKSRMCTLAEVQRTVEIPDLSMDTAWVNTERYSPTDAADRFSDCGGWSNPGGVGVIVDDLGRFEAASSCSEAHAVACCAPSR